MKDIPIQKHVGVYGIAIRGGHILMIKKSRGPYTGMYDLPGGRIEEGETKEVALHREFIEEVGCTIQAVVFLSDYEDSLEFVNVKDNKVSFHHFGSYYKVTLSDGCEIKTTPDEHDSLGAEWVSIQDIQDEKIQVPNIVKKSLSKFFNCSADLV